MVRGWSMPALIEIPLRLERSPSAMPTARQLHGAVSSALQGHPESALSTWPLLTAADESRLLLRLGWKTEGLPPSSLTQVDRQWRIGGSGTSDLIARSGPAHIEWITFEEIATAPPVEEVVLHVSSPAVFRSTGYQGFKRRIPLPDPERIYRRLLTEWNRFATRFPVPEDHLRGLLQCLEIVDWEPAMGEVVIDRDLRGRESIVKGFQGDVRIGLRGPRPPGAASLLTAASLYGQVAGVGNWTNRGFGACTVTLAGTSSRGSEWSD